MAEKEAAKWIYDKVRAGMLLSDREMRLAASVAAPCPSCNGPVRADQYADGRLEITCLRCGFNRTWGLIATVLGIRREREPSWVHPRRSRACTGFT